MVKHAYIYGIGAVSAAGIGVPPLLQAVRNNRPLLSKNLKFKTEPFADHKLGVIPKAAWEQLIAGNPDIRHQPAMLMALDAAHQAMTQAAPALSGIAPERVGLVLGSTKAEIGILEEAIALRHKPEPAAIAAQPHVMASQIATNLNLRGPTQAVSMACASGLFALQQAAMLLRDGHADAVLALGVDLLSAFVVSGFYALRAMDPDGCRPFDQSRRGLSPGAAAAAAVLLPDSRVTRPLASVLGWSSSNDANHLTGPSRDGFGLALAMQRALRFARIQPGDIAYVHAHGTGTAYNDAMECLALQKIFQNQPPPFASTKAITGHTMGAAGLLETILVVASAKNGIWPGTPGLIEPDPAAPLSLARQPVQVSGSTMFLKINSGFSGINAAVILDVL